MVQVNIPLPEDIFTKLNSTLINEYGYDLQSHIYQFIYSEYLKFKEDVLPQQVTPTPSPSLYKNHDDQWKVKIKYPDHVINEVEISSGEEGLKLITDWSKYSYDPDSLQKLRFDSTTDSTIDSTAVSFDYISESSGAYRVRKHLHNKFYSFGSYSMAEAMIVRDFLMKEKWDIKYSWSNQKNNFRNPQEYGKWLVKLASKSVNV